MMLLVGILLLQTVGNMIKICAISDTHTYHNQLTIPECDLLLHAGDFTSMGSLTDVTSFASWFSKQPAKHKIAIPGNHDFFCEDNSYIAKEIFKQVGTTLLIDQAITIEGVNIYGSPWQPWFHSWAFNFPEHEPAKSKKAEETWKLIPDNTNILLVHGPPYNILDKVMHPRQWEDPNVGCKALRKRIQELHDLKLVITGHIHEANGHIKLNNIDIYNVAICQLGNQFSNTREPVTIEF